MRTHTIDLCYCTNVHPAETWLDTLASLELYTLPVRDQLIQEGVLENGQLFAIGLRLSAIAANTLIHSSELTKFKQWLSEHHCYVYTINGFPYGAFHNERVKEQVYRPDWTSNERLDYTKKLFFLISELCPNDTGGSISTLPGSFKAFEANEERMFSLLYACAEHIDSCVQSSGKDLHLGLEPEPLGHFENTEEAILFLQRFFKWALTKPLKEKTLRRYIGINFDTCHFALEFEDCATALKRFNDEGIRISKIHLSNAIEVTPSDTLALETIKKFNEPTYLHQVMLQHSDGSVDRYEDLDHFFKDLPDFENTALARIHFHIPLYQNPPAPLRSTATHTKAALEYLADNPSTCSHVEMETYTWGVFPSEMQKPLVEQLVEEYLWTLKHV